MAYIDWNEKLSVGIKLFDDQHKELINIINKLHDAMKEGKGSKVPGDIFIELIKYTEYHFLAEENYFKEYEYPEEKSHKLAHKMLLEKAQSLLDDFNSGKILITVKLFEFLNNWITSHILSTDKEYTEYLKDKEIV